MKSFAWIGSVLLLLLLLCGTALWVAQSQWLRSKILSSIIEQTEKASGGRVEIGSFDLDWRTLTAQLNRFVVHGGEPAGQAPLLSVDSVKVRLRVISLLRRDIAIQGIEVSRPRVHVIVAADGSTNLPRPKTAAKGALPERILDLRIARFNVREGMFAVDTSGHPTHWIPWNAQGEHLTAQLEYDAAQTRYSGDVALGSLLVRSVNLQVRGRIAIEKNRVLISDAVANTKASAIHFTNTSVTDFHSPVTTGRYQARVSLVEASELLSTGVKATGFAVLEGNARFVSQTEYSVVGQAHATDVNLNQLRNVRLDAQFNARPGEYALDGIRMNVFGGQFTGSLESADLQTYRLLGNTSRLNLRQVASVITRQPLPYNAEVSGPVQLNGRPGHMNTEAHLELSPVRGSAPVRGDVIISYNTASAKVNLGDSWLELPRTRLSASGTLGDRLKVNFQSNDFAELLPALDIATGGKTPSISFSSAVFDGTVSGRMADPRIAGQISVRDGVFQDYRVSALSGDITASGNLATISHGDFVYGDVHARGAGSIQLTNWAASGGSVISASVEIPSADVGKLLAMTGHKEVQITGTLNTSTRVSGTLNDPLADADIAMTKGVFYQQPFDSISGKLQVINRTTQSLAGVFAAGSKRVNITARFEHAGTQFPAGTLDFNLTSNTMPISQIALVRERQPDIRGFGRFHAEGELKIGHNAKHEVQFSITSLNADATANSVELAGRNLGDARFTAQTKGDLLSAHFESNAANAAIRGDGTVQLAGDYPVNGKVAFSDASLNSLVTLALKKEDATPLNFDGTAAGELTFSGPARNMDLFTASLNMPKVEMHPLPGSVWAQTLPNFSVKNSGPVRATLKNAVIHIESAHFKAPETDVTLEGSVSPRLTAPLNLHVEGQVNLALARTMNPDLVSSGFVALNTTVRGTWTSPDVSGRASMRNADFHYSDFANGLTSANGEFTFSGSHATIQSFTAQSGGGKVEATGFGAFTNGLLSFRVEAQAHQVRVRYPEGISSVSDAALTFAGTSQRSETSGMITVHRVSINPRSDAATILANAAGPAQTPAAKNSLASNMNLDVQVSTAPDVALQTSVTQSLQADANLRLRGTATNPALIGRINITQGEMVFFGNKYSINNGSISFFNPAKIDPILNIDLETKARGVDVILTVSGPIDKLNVNYRSDPPLQFSDIVALLATGRAPSDATLSSRDTGQSQNFQQLGASALIGQAIANPVAGRLQRFFGVSRLKIDPSLTGVTGSPEARLTIEQQVTPDILFTYITDVSSTSTQLIRVEWSFNPHWSAILIREENGYVGLDFAYKKRFK